MSYKKSSGNRGGLEVKGGIHIPFDDAGAKSDESDDEDDDDDMWLDYSNDGGGRVRTKKPKISNVSIVQETGKKHACKGRFPLTDIYWTVRVKINKTWLQSPPAYFIEQSNGMKPYHVNLFIDDCMKISKKTSEPVIKDSMKACFEIFCRERLKGEPLTFFNLESTLQSYRASEKEGCSFIKFPGYSDVVKWGSDDHGIHIETAIYKTGLGCTVLRAVSHPVLVECVSKLLPFSFQDYMCKLLPSKLAIAEAMAKSSPWEFCFRQILFAKLSLSGAEAYLSNYEKSGYLAITPLREKDALYIYEVLKVDAQRNGHMFTPFRRMAVSSYFDKLEYKITKIERWNAALDYLDENKVIVREEFAQDVNIFLYHNWKAEVDAVKGFETVLTQYEPEVDNMDVDFESSDFDKIRGDTDQLRASHLISHLPIVVMSGMGGCGKTTVVTNLLKHICDRHEKNLAQSKEGELSQQLEETNIADEDANALDTKCGGDNSTCFKTEEKMNKDELSEDSDGEKEGETSRIVESKEGKLRRELKEDLLKILKDKKDVDNEEMKCFKRKILLVAPTGKAARLLGCKAKLPSATIHSVVMSWRTWRDNKEEVKEWTYSHVKILVIDECSLLSVRLFAAIVSILLEHAQLSKLILLGDIKQLPSIEPGDFLRDIFRAFSKPSYGYGVELTQNHRSESALIVENAKRIANRRVPTFDPEQRFHFIELDEGGGDNERDQAIRSLLHHNPDVQCHVQSQFVSFRNAHCRAINELCCKYYNNHSLLMKTNKSKEVFHFEPGDKICLGKNHKVISHEEHLREYILEIQHLLEDDMVKGSSRHLRKQDASLMDSDMNRTRTNLSAAEVTSLFTGDESDLDKTVSDLRQKKAETTALREERKARAAQKQKEWKEKHKTGQGSQESGEKEKKKNEEKLCNGEVFFIMDEKLVESQGGRTVKYLILSDRDPNLPRVVCVAEKSLRKDCKMKHSWVRTIHTYQGSESETVVYFLGPAIPQNWQHVYTAVTRGKKSVYIVGKMSQLNIAVERNSWPRNSRLHQRLNDMLVCQSEDVEKLKGDRQSTTGHGDPDQSLSQSFENSDDSWISSLPDPYFTQAINTVSVPTMSEEKEEKVNASTDKNNKWTGPCGRPKSSITLKHPKVLNTKSKADINSLVKEVFEDDFDITGFSDSDIDEDNPTDQRVPSTHILESVPVKFDKDNYSNNLAQDTSVTSRKDMKDNPNNLLQNKGDIINHFPTSPKSPSRCSSSSQTPKKTPPRPSSSFTAEQSPSKQRRLNDVIIDTPFRDSFKSALSLDPHDENEEEPIPVSPRSNVKRKLL